MSSYIRIRVTSINVAKKFDFVCPVDKGIAYKRKQYCLYFLYDVV